MRTWMIPMIPQCGISVALMGPLCLIRFDRYAAGCALIASYFEHAGLGTGWASGSCYLATTNDGSVMSTRYITLVFISFSMFFSI